MADQKPLFKAPYDIKDVSVLFAIVAFVLIIAAIVGNNLVGLFQQNVNFGWFFWWKTKAQTTSTSSKEYLKNIFIINYLANKLFNKY